jgi:hypothetical protein
VAVILSLPILHFEQFYWWPKIVDPALILLGFLGSTQRSKIFRVVGWSGILLFAMHGCTLIMPGEDYMSGGSDGPGPMTPRLVGPGEIGARLAIIVALVSALVLCFRRVKRNGDAIRKQED